MRGPDKYPPDDAAVDDAEALGGDPVCWLSSVCPECGAFREGPGRCWRCGAG